jgi:diaminopimelate decarboxylase
MGVTNKASWISPGFKTIQKGKRSLFVIGGVSVEEIANHIPPPFYVYDAETIKVQYRQLEETFKPFGISIYYAVKPNAALAIVDGLYKLGAGLDVGSLGELLIAQKIGANPKKISFAGPVKNDEALEFAVSYGVHIINAESEDELQRINVIAKRKGVIQKVALRINIKRSTKNTTHQVMAGSASKFGIDEEQITESFIKNIRKLSHIDLSGIHVYLANMLGTDAFLENVENICRIGMKLNEYFPVRSVDFGGGFTVPYAKKEQAFQLDEITKHLGEILQQFAFLKKNNVALSIEPGRFLVAQSGIYVAKVAGVKVSRGKKFVLVDGGIHHFLRPSIVNGTHPLYNISRINEKDDETMSVGGALCTPIDYLGKDVTLPKATKRGDLIGCFVAGAYGWSEAMPFFMSMQTAAEVLVNNGKYELIRKAEHPREFLKQQIILEGNRF